MRNDGEWTEGRYRSFITSTLRGGMRRWPPKWKALKKAELGRKTNKKTGKLAMHFLCYNCKEEYTAKDVQVDHVNPVVDPATGFVSWDLYIDRLFCEQTNLQVLCTKCHKLKTKEENESTRISRASNKVRITDSEEPRVSKPRASRGSGGSSKPSSKSSTGQRRERKQRVVKKRAR